MKQQKSPAEICYLLIKQIPLHHLDFGLRERCLVLFREADGGSYGWRLGSSRLALEGRAHATYMLSHLKQFSHYEINQFHRYASFLLLGLRLIRMVRCT